ncbi:OmpP1/FadL family transporter [Vibrio vulnificus]|nr:outer membrane protein transport protein [Vibrio vulnificus]ELI3521011.1 outer membrane protein transport protein [Vibrio vulnificus]
MPQCHLCLTALTAALLSCQAYAAATLVSEMSHLNVGTAGAGTAVSTDGASSAYANPAAMSHLEQSHIAVNLASMALNIEYDDDRSSSLNSHNAGGIQPYGSFYFVTPLSEQFTFGLSLVATGGSGLDYGNQYAGRLGLNDLKLSVIQWNPVLSYRITPHWSFGGGLQIERANFEQTFMSHHASIQSHSYALGYNLGTTYHVNDNHLLGLTYRSSMTHNLAGTLQMLEQSRDIELGFLNAARIELAASHKLAAPITVVWSLGQEYWGANQQTTIQTGDLIGQKQRGFNDVWFVSMGGQLAITPTLKVEIGAGYVSSPLDNPAWQSSDLPADQQIKYSIGTQYLWSKSILLKAYYSYVDYGSPRIDNGLMQGSFDNHNQFFGLELNYRY